MLYTYGWFINIAIYSSSSTSAYYHLPQLLTLFKYHLEVMFLLKVESEDAEANLKMMHL